MWGVKAMRFFENYTSNTLGGSGNQSFFVSEPGQVHTGRVFYKIFCEGAYNYSLLFSNIIDSTYSDGDFSHKNLICDAWELLEAKAAVCDRNLIPTDFADSKTATAVNGKVGGFTRLTFGGSKSKTVFPGEFFATDPVPLRFSAGDYLCLEITFSGKMIPYHEESILPVFVKTETGWEYSKRISVRNLFALF